MKRINSSHGQSEPTPGAGGAGVTDEAASFRRDLLGGGAEGLDVAAVHAEPRLGQRGVLVLALLAAAGSIGAMRWAGMGPRSSLGEVKVDYDLTSSGPAGRDHRRVLEDLSQAGITAQVPPEQVQRNPFRIAGSLEPEGPVAAPAPGNPEPDTGAGARAEAERRRQLAQERQNQLRAALAGLSIKSILGGSDPATALVRISGETYRVGDVVEGVFTVREINRRGVVLEADGQSFALDMAVGDAPRGGARRK
ncbi:MAG TPA: general secretion pathway protein GspB [Phycisphaerales bacterium]|nr:general secretion pathway protein GspB [Phycisphaerales bacterium]